jgi:hypothetical protein
MPGALFLVLRAWHPMIGRDMHIPWPPGSPAPAPAPVPYLTTMVMMGTGITSKYTTDTFADGLTPVMCKGTDIGPLIPHIGPPSTTLPIEILTSGSKSHFGPSYYTVKDQTGADNHPAVALLMSVNPNLNCGTPMPLPMGMVLALTTHALGMSWGDIAAGLYNMAVDFCLQTVLQAAGGALGESVGKAATYLTRELAIGAALAAGPLGRALGPRAIVALERFAQASEPLVATAVGQLGGTPLGTTSANFGLPGFYDRAVPAVGLDSAGDNFGQAVDNYLNSPSVEDVNQPVTTTPSPAPAAGVTPPPPPPPATPDPAPGPPPTVPTDGGAGDTIP